MLDNGDEAVEDRRTLSEKAWETGEHDAVKITLDKECKG
jgi:hypothetical protein